MEQSVFACLVCTRTFGTITTATIIRAGEMVQCLSVLAALVWFPAPTTGISQPLVTLDLGDLRPSSDSTGTTLMCTYLHADTLIHRT